MNFSLNLPRCSRSASRTIFGLLMGLSLVAGASAAAPLPAPVVKSEQPLAAPLLIPKALFDTNQANGKDPFFPDSRRRDLGSKAGGSAVVPSATGFLSQLVLKGISGTKDRRLALINNTTMSVGEKAALKFDTQKITIRCVEIRERSVVVSIDGSNELREIALRKDL